MSVSFDVIGKKLIQQVGNIAESADEKEYIRREISLAVDDIRAGLQGGFQRLNVIAARVGGAFELCVNSAISDLQCLVDSRRKDFLQDQALKRGIDVAIVCALQSPELEAVLNLFDRGPVEYHEWTDNPHMAYLGMFRSKAGESESTAKSVNVVAAHQDRMGMVDCALLAAKVIREWSPRYLVMTGICGGWRKQNVRLGDIVVPTSVYTYQSGKYIGGEFKREIRSVHVQPAIIRQVQAVSKKLSSLVSKGWHDEVTSNPSILTETMACGDAVVDDEEMLEAIAVPDRKLVAVDMESYALIRAAELLPQYGTTALVVKGVSDFAYHKTDTSAREYAAFTSANFLYHFLLSELM